MDWALFLTLVTSSLFMTAANIYAWYKLSGKSTNFKDHKLYKILIVLTLLGAIFNYSFPTYLKLPLMFFISVFAVYRHITKKAESSTALVLVTMGLSMVAEVVIVLVASLFLGDYVETFVARSFGNIILNICTSIFIVLGSQHKYAKAFYEKLVVIFNRMKRNKLIICCIATIGITIIFMITTYMDLPKSIILLINSSLVIVYVIVIIRLSVTREKMKAINSKYEMSLSSLKSFENVMNQYRIDNHENKNQLLTIRNMVKSKDKKTIDYIDKIIDNKIKDNEDINYRTFKIPEGGLRATIYPKLTEMKELHIKYILDVSNGVSALDLININEDTMLNSCKIIGVFLDNAIDAVKNLKKKEIIIEIFMLDDFLCIDIGNNYKGPLDMEKISNAGYTTKGDNHGYGLALVSKIIKNDDHLENEKLLTKNKFTQRLKIKM